MSLSSGQRALWFLQQLSPESVAYNVSRAVHVDGNVDPAIVGKALNVVIQRHPSLRASFPSINGKPVCKIYPNREASYSVEDASHWSDAQIQDRLSREMVRPFDLASDPLLRALFLHRAKGESIFVLSVHHIITDLWTMAMFMDDISAVYHALHTGSSEMPPPPTARYSDWVEAQREMLESAEGMDHQAFWLKHLEGSLPVVQLPADRPRPPVQTYNGASRSFIISPEIAGLLKQLAKNGKTSLFTLVMAAFHVLLSRYTSQDDIVVGTPKSGRSLKFAKVLGYFVNPVVIRTRPVGTLTFSEFLQQVHQTTSDCFAHDAYPFPLLVEKLQPARDPSRSPVFQIMFAWQKTIRLKQVQNLIPFVMNESGGSIRFHEFELHSIGFQQLVSLFDLSFLFAETDASLATAIEYNTDLFDEETIARMQKNFETLLQGIAENPETRLCDLPVLSQEEQAFVMRSERRIPEDASGNIVALFEQQVAKAPSDIALMFDDTHVSYKELNDSANRLAGTLRQKAVGSQKPVGVMLDRSVQSIVALLAILKCGGTYLPLDPSLPPERNRFMITDAGVLHVIGIGSRKEVDDSVEWIDIDDAIRGTGGDHHVNPRTTIHDESAAYIIYTSGSTGVPKGVQISYRSLALHCNTMRHHYELTRHDRMLQFASLSFDASLEQILPPLVAGATLVLRGRELWTPQEFCRHIIGNKVSIINVPPAYWHQVVQQCALHPELAEGNGVRLIIIGGDVFQPESVRLWRETPFRNARLLNAYGPTETTITASTYEVQPAHHKTQRRIPIGKPLGNRTMYILDRSMNPLPIGATGELYIGGESAAMGYLRAPALTAEKFIPDPFSSKPGSRLYRTGDLVRLTSDGNYVFVERTDQQVKIRGFRVELEEIEAMLGTHPAVRDVVTTIHRPSDTDKRIVAYVVPRGNKPLRVEDLKAHMLSRLPAYMVPSLFMTLSDLPFSPSGKVNREALPSPADGEVLKAGDYVRPRTPIEEELAGMWAGLLGVERVGIHDNFFDLGGHSLLATQIVSRVREMYGLEIPLHRMFETPTVAELSDVIVQALTEDSSEEELKEALNELNSTSFTQRGDIS